MNTSARRGHSAAGVVPAAAAVVWTLIALVGFAVLPAYSTYSATSASSSSDGSTVTTTSESTIFEHEGRGVLVVLLVPVALALLGLVGTAFGVRPLTISAAGVALGLCVLGMASIGLFYLPAAALLVIAAVRSASAGTGSKRRDGSSSPTASAGRASHSSSRP